MIHGPLDIASPRAIRRAIEEAVPVAATTPSSVPRLEVYGHSYGNDAGATNARYGFVQRLALMLGVPAANVQRVVLSGGRVADKSASNGVANLLNGGLARDLTAGPYVTRGGLKLCINGANDWGPYHTASDGGAALVEGALRLAFSTLLSARMIPALASATLLNNAANGGPLVFSTSPAWTALSDATVSLSPGEAYVSGVAGNGAYVEYTLGSNYNGEAITAILPQAANNKYIGTISVNGVDKVSIDTTLVNAGLVAGVGTLGYQSATVGLRLPPGIASAGQTVRYTITGLIAGQLGGIAGFVIEGHDPPPLLLPTIPIQPSNPSNQNTSAAYQTARNAAVASEFPTAEVIDLSGVLDDETLWSHAGDQSAQVGHPNNNGYAKMAEAVYPTARALCTPAVVARMNV